MVIKDGLEFLGFSIAELPYLPNPKRPRQDIAFLLAGKLGLNWLLAVKEKNLTDAERRFAEKWGGGCWWVESLEAAINVCNLGKWLDEATSPWNPQPAEDGEESDGAVSQAACGN